MGHEEVAKMLVQKGIDLNQINGEKKTALHLAIEKGHEGIAKFLIASGAKVNLKECHGRMPLHCAAEGGLLGVVEALVSHKAKLNEKSNYCGTPLHCAVWTRTEGESERAMLEVVKFLLSKGAKPNITNEGGKTPLDIALAAEDDEMVKLLRSYGGKQAGELKKETPSEGKDE